MRPIRLGVNVDHIATVRQARRGERPDPVEAALEAEKGGADSIVCHLREDRRHIQDHDVFRLRKRMKTRLNLEMGLAPDIIEVALEAHPDQVTLVPERRQELTTEGGLDIRGQIEKIRQAVTRFGERGIEVSLFVDPDLRQISACKQTGASIVEIHTGAYANALSKFETQKIVAAARSARRNGFQVAAGHGLDIDNVRAVASIPEIEELNIGHSIISLALLTGLRTAVRRMKEAMDGARRR